MKKTSIRELYYFTMICHIFTLLCGIVGSVIIPIFSNEFINFFDKVFGIIFIIGVVGAFLILIVFSIDVIITLLRDLTVQ